MRTTFCPLMFLAFSAQIGLGLGRVSSSRSHHLTACKQHSRSKPNRCSTTTTPTPTQPPAPPHPHSLTPAPFPLPKPTANMRAYSASPLLVLVLALLAAATQAFMVPRAPLPFSNTPTTAAKHRTREVCMRVLCWGGGWVLVWCILRPPFPPPCF